MYKKNFGKTKNTKPTKRKRIAEFLDEEQRVFNECGRYCKSNRC